MQEKYFPTNQLQSIDNTQSFIPLAHGQRALWHLYQMAPKSTALNIYCTVEFSSEFNLTSWHRAWQKIGERHSILRTTYTSREGQPVQVVDPHREVQLDVTDASNWSEDYLKTQIIATADRPFDLEKDSVLRVQLYTRQDKPSVQVLVMHQIAGDMWSFDILLEELQLLYTTEMEVLEGDSPKGNDVINKIDQLPWQYTDYVSWQQKTLESAKGKQLWAYWKQELAGELPVLNLPTDRRRPPVQTYDGNSQFIELDEALLEKLRDVGKCEGASLYTLLLAAFLVQLYRYTNQEDILVGSAMAGRSAHQEFKKIVGYFSDPVVLRANLSGNPTFKEFLAQIRGTVFRALRHQDYPFPLLVEQLDANRDLSRPPLFQVAFTWQKHRWYKTTPNCSGKQGKNLSMKPYSNGIQRGSVLDLNLQIEEVGSSLVANWQYNTDLFDAATVSRMAGHFQTLLEAIVANPEQRLAQLSLLTEAERNQLLVEWNNTRTDYPQDKCIHQLFEEQVERTPDAVAVVFEDSVLTYRELNAKANQVAHYLQKLGVGPEVLVGICVERSLEMVVGLLGILKAGGAYVPLDPAHPSERLSFMLSDTQVPVLLTQQRLVNELPKSNVLVVCLDSDWNPLTQKKQENPSSKVTPDNLSYVIYTSGSTGKPKGVMNTHRGLCNRLLWMQDAYQLTETDCVLQKTPFSFDVSVWEFFWPLLTGSRLVIAQPEGHKDSAYLVNLIAKQKITTLHFVPSMLEIFLEEEGLEVCNCIKRIICSGEALPFDLQENFFIRLDAELHNLYGPTEASIDVTFWLCKRESNQHIVPIGRPIANTQTYILDSHLQPVPVGVSGELHIGGIGLARGYLNRPELTEEKFIPNPFSNEPGVRLYKTGDLARYLPEGNIEFLGRLDNQVKIRGGLRIELGEVESVISQHSTVQQTVVTASEDVLGYKRLVAYVVPNLKRASITKELRRYLKEKLPEYMVPGIFIFLNALPLTSNGKVDRHALPAPNQSRPELEEAFVTPRTPVEEMLAVIWRQVLGLEQVGIHDNFFELGGDSIRMIQIISQVREIGLDFSIQQFFQYPTIYQLAQEVNYVEASSLATAKTKAFSLISNEERLKIPEDVEDAYPMSMLQKGMLFHSEHNPESHFYQVVISYHIQSLLDVQAFITAVRQLVNQHPVLRTSFDLVSFSEPMQLVNRIVNVPLDVKDICHLSQCEQEKVLAIWMTTETRRTFDWTHPPLLRFALHKRTEETFQFGMSFHDSILDGWSAASAIVELFRRYLACLEQKALFSELSTSVNYRDFVALEQITSESEELKQYWIEELKDSKFTKLRRWSSCIERNDIPQNLDLEIPICFEVFKGLKKLARTAGVPLKSVLLAAHLRVLNLLSDQSDIVTGLVCNGRLEESDGDRTLGNFLNTVPFRFKLLGGRWIDLVRDVFNAERKLIPYRRYPYAQLQKALGGRPLFETVFNFTQFHVYETFKKLNNFCFLEGKGTDPFHYALAANFRINSWKLHGAALFVDKGDAEAYQEAMSDLLVVLNYNNDQLTYEQVNTIGKYYIKTLTVMAKQPFSHYENQYILPDQEHQKILVEWNDAETDALTQPELEEVFVAPRTPVEEMLAEIWRQVLGLEQVGIHDNFFELGGDSILSLMISHKANHAGLRLTSKQIFDNPTIVSLTVVVGTNLAIPSEQGVITGSVPLTPIQHWFFEQNLPEPQHWNAVFSLEVQQTLDAALLEQALQQLFIHHDALRLRFEQQGWGWQQINAGVEGTVSLSKVDLSKLSEVEQKIAIETMTRELHSSLNLSEVPLLRSAFFNLGSQRPNKLLLVIHHLVIDGVSWRILIEDLQTAYQQLSQDQAIRLPKKTTSFKHWAEQLTEYAQEQSIRQELTYWLTESQKQIYSLPVDYPEGANTEDSVDRVSVLLSIEETRALLHEVPAVYRTQINDVLLTAMVQAFEHWTGEASLLIDLQSHGREAIFEDIDLSRTVGWFTTIFPTLLHLRKSSNLGDIINSVKEQLRNIPNRGIGYGLLRYLIKDTEIQEQLQNLPQAEVNFNYLGQFDQVVSESPLFKLAQESSGFARSPKGTRRYLLEVNGLVMEGKLQLTWSYSKNLYRDSTINSLAQNFRKVLRLIIAHCQSPDAGGYTPSDFPLAQLNQQKLNQIIAKASEINQ